MNGGPGTTVEYLEAEADRAIWQGRANEADQLYRKAQEARALGSSLEDWHDHLGSALLEDPEVTVIYV